MLPSVVTREIIDALSAQLRSQFPSTTSGFLKDADQNGDLRSIITELIEDKQRMITSVSEVTVIS